MPIPHISEAIGDPDATEGDFVTVCRYCWQKIGLQGAACLPGDTVTTYICGRCRSVIVEIRRAEGDPAQALEHLRSYRDKTGKWDIWSSTMIEWSSVGSGTPQRITSAVPLARSLPELDD